MVVGLWVALWWTSDLLIFIISKYKSAHTQSEISSYLPITHIYWYFCKTWVDICACMTNETKAKPDIKCIKSFASNLNFLTYGDFFFLSKCFITKQQGLRSSSDFKPVHYSSRCTWMSELTQWETEANATVLYLRKMTNKCKGQSNLRVYKQPGVDRLADRAEEAGQKSKSRWTDRSQKLRGTTGMKSLARSNKSPWELKPVSSIVVGCVVSNIKQIHWRGLQTVFLLFSFLFFYYRNVRV